MAGITYTPRTSGSFRRHSLGMLEVLSFAIVSQLQISWEEIHWGI